MKMMMALIAMAIASGCGPEPEPSTHTVPALETAALAAHGLGAGSLREIQLLATPDGRDVLSHVVSCALPPGVSITAISRDGTPYSFTGRAGLAPAWIARAATAAERRRVDDCVRAHTPGMTRA